MRKLIYSLAAAATLGFGALTMQPAQAQPYYPGYHPGPYGNYRPGYRPYRHGYRPAYHPGRGYYRPAYVAPRCWTQMQRHWNGFVWVQRPVRVCR
ncbi:hypothetical protein AB4072_02760 [Microvirga sp. 2MCAF38]|uniref:hypothetical protein n=1 Tax=Microvirga sp. 2MCAF38 TaxID=3232989 RepID=UPI003F9B6B34